MNPYEQLESLRLEYKKLVEDTGFTNWQNYHNWLEGRLYGEQGHKAYVQDLSEDSLKTLIRFAQQKLDEKHSEDKVTIWSVQSELSMISYHFLSIGEAYQKMQELINDYDWEQDSKEHNYRCDWLVYSHQVNESEVDDYI